MFDANMRRLPKDTEFFAEFRGVHSNNILKKYSEKHSVIRCKMLSDENEDPLVRFYLDDGWSVDISDSESFYDLWVSYAGMIDGRDFIDERLRSEAMSMMRETKK